MFNTSLKVLKIVTLTTLLAFICTACAAPKSTEKLDEKSTDIPTPTNLDETIKKSKSCVCIMLYQPVCGENGKTYSNACESKCANVKIKKAGACLDQ